MVALKGMDDVTTTIGITTLARDIDHHPIDFPEQNLREIGQVDFRLVSTAAKVCDDVG